MRERPCVFPNAVAINAGQVRAERRASERVGMYAFTVVLAAAPVPDPRSERRRQTVTSLVLTLTY